MARRVAEDGVLIADILLGVLAVLVIRGHYFRYSRVQKDLDSRSKFRPDSGGRDN